MRKSHGGGRPFPSAEDRLEFAARIRLARKACGMTQVELATVVGLRQSAMSRIERGERGVELFEILAICAALDSPLIDIVPDRWIRFVSPEGPDD